MSLSKLNTFSPVGRTSDDGEVETSGCATISDIPPEILTLILEYLLDGNRKTMFSYRLINSQWKLIIDSHLEKRMISGVLRPFPQMRLKSNQPSILHANCCPTMFLKGSNPFPFNSLVANGLEGPGWQWNSASNPFYEVPNTLEDFGANLSCFALWNYQLGINELASMLGWMPCLQRLSLCYGRRPTDNRGRVVIPSPPPLPHLTSLELDIMDQLNHGPCLWLAISYADQLFHLSIRTWGCPFEPLRKQHQYRADFGGKTVVVGTTSGAAFGKLKKLKMHSPSQEFLQLSETPTLQHFTVICLPRRNRASDFVKFIDGCNNTLQTLHVDVGWDDWNDNGKEWVKSKQKPTAPKLKTITIPYPKNKRHKSILERSSFLQPGLEVLHLIHFEIGPDEILMHPNYNELNMEIHSCDEKERAELKQQLASLDQQAAVLQGKLNLVLLRQQEARRARRTAAKAARKGGAYGWPQLAAERRLIIQQWKENAALRRQIYVCRKEKAPLHPRLHVLNQKAATAKELRELEIWSNYPKLKVVSVSCGDDVTGDICVIRRMDAVGLP